MDNKKIIIIGAIVVIAALLIGGYLFLNNETHNDRVFFISKSAYMKVPDANATHKPDKHGVYHYIDNENRINVTSYNSNLSKESGLKVIEKLKNSAMSNSKEIKENDVLIYDNNGTYSIIVENAEYNDTVIIQSTNKNLLVACWKTLKFHDPNEVIKIDNSTSSINAVEEIESAMDDDSSSSSSSSSDTSSSDDDWVDDFDDFDDFDYFDDFDDFDDEATDEADVDVDSGDIDDI